MHLLIVDLSHIFWTHWHASAHEPQGSAYASTLATIRKLVSDDGFDRVALAIDKPPYKRLEIHADYKANREKQPEAARELLRTTIDTLRREGLPVLGSRGAEADDVIATCVREARAAGHSVTIASADKDLLQLLTDDPPRVSWLSTRTWERSGASDVEPKLGVPPSMVRDLLALTGDTSDNIPGVRGIGNKHGAALLKTWGSLAEILANCDKLEPERFRVPVMQHGDQLRKNVQLVTLDGSVPIEADWSDLRFSVETPAAEPVRGFDDLGEDYGDAPVTVQPSGESERRSADVPPHVELSDSGGASPPNVVPESPLPPTGDPVPTAPPGEPSSIGGTAVAASVPPGGRGSNGESRSIVVSSDAGYSLALDPQSTRDAIQLAKWLHASKMYQKFPNAEAIFAAMVRGRELGLGALTSLDMFHCIEGKLAMHAQLISGLVLTFPACDYFECVETTDTLARYETQRRGRKPIAESFSIEDAIRYGSLSRQPDGSLRGRSQSGKPSNWDKDPRNMLRVRAATRLARIVYPDRVAGLYAPEEFE